MNHRSLILFIYCFLASLKPIFAANIQSPSLEYFSQFVDRSFHLDDSRSHGVDLCPDAFTLVLAEGEPNTLVFYFQAQSSEFRHKGNHLILRTDFPPGRMHTFGRRLSPNLGVAYSSLQQGEINGVLHSGFYVNIWSPRNRTQNQRRHFWRLFNPTDDSITYRIQHGRRVECECVYSL